MNRSFGYRALPIVFAGAVAALVAADDPKKPPATPLEAHQREVAEVTAALRDSWPDHPEWVDMLTSILVDEPMSAEFGWFRTAVSQTRFDWSATRKRFDRDGNGTLASAAAEAPPLAAAPPADAGAARLTASAAFA